MNPAVAKIRALGHYTELARQADIAFNGTPGEVELDQVDRIDLVYVVGLAIANTERTPEQQDALVRVAALLDNPFCSWSYEAISSWLLPEPARLTTVEAGS